VQRPIKPILRKRKRDASGMSAWSGEDYSPDPEFCGGGRHLSVSWGDEMSSQEVPEFTPGSKRRKSPVLEEGEVSPVLEEGEVSP
jgi:hypothetical protein